MIGANYRAVDHLESIRRRPALVQGVHDVLPETCPRPASELPVDARPFAKFLRQVAPWGTGASDPEYPIKNKAVVGRFAPIRRTDRQDKPFKERPFLVRHQVSCQAGLHRRYQLELYPHRDVNPFCQHGLAEKDVTLLLKQREKTLKDPYQPVAEWVGVKI